MHIKSKVRDWEMNPINVQSMHNKNKGKTSMPSLIKIENEERL